MSASEIIFASDLHAHRWRQASRLTANGTNDRLLDCVSVIDEISAYAVEHGIEYAVWAGDLFHKRAVLDVETFNQVFDAFRRSHLRWYLMDGNHDQATKDGRVHSLEPFRALQNVEVMKRRQNRLIYGSMFHFFPYQDDESATMQDLNEAVVPRKQVLNVAVMHHGFRGARVGGHLETQVKEPIDSEAIRAFGYDWVISGHYHAPQRVSDHVYYIGAPLQHVRKDANVDRGFRVLNLETNKLRLVPIERPRFVEVRFTGHGFAANGRDSIKGNFVDLIMDEPDQWVIDDAYKLGARWVEPHYLPKLTLSKSSKRLDVDPTMDPGEIVDRYVDYAVDNDETTLDKDLLKRVGRELIKEVGR